MTAQTLLETLQRLSESGVDLSTLNVVVPYSVYTGEYWLDGERYPDDVRVNAAYGDLVLE